MFQICQDNFHAGSGCPPAPFSYVYVPKVSDQYFHFYCLQLIKHETSKQTNPGHSMQKKCNCLWTIDLTNNLIAYKQ